MLVKTYETSRVLCKNKICFLPIFNLSFFKSNFYFNKIFNRREGLRLADRNRMWSFMDE